jgi:hypothetical protein
MKSYSIAANGRFVTLASGELDKPALHLFEQCRRQWPVISGLAVYGTNAGAWSDGAIAFGQHSPGSLVIKTQAVRALRNLCRNAAESGEKQ